MARASSSSPGAKWLRTTRAMSRSGVCAFYFSIVNGFPQRLLNLDHDFHQRNKLAPAVEVRAHPIALIVQRLSTGRTTSTEPQ
ncbi:hypothetical protein ETAA8_18740 [Anatilimnocola aggregata]|uniref:Uncharacterized protein n=1 Tax=Anatilimnocola aggregata TaxID=2528021 RepID=A0A517Y9C0_9BACT|nr:hypothetical protein ETAA8_18740 [Anatilimnocola aggregata]